MSSIGTGLLNWCEKNIDFPAVVLIAILVLGLWVLWKTQQDKNNDFNFEDMLRDDNGKPSAYRLAIFVCLAVSTWVVMYLTIVTQGKLDTWIFAWYIAVWSGAKVAEKGIEAYASRGGVQNGNNSYPNYQPNTSLLQQSNNLTGYQPATQTSNNLTNSTINQQLQDDSPQDADEPGGGLRDAIPQDVLTARSAGRN